MGRGITSQGPGGELRVPRPAVTQPGGAMASLPARNRHFQLGGMASGDVTVFVYPKTGSFGLERNINDPNGIGTPIGNGVSLISEVVIGGSGCEWGKAALFRGARTPRDSQLRGGSPIRSLGKRRCRPRPRAAQGDTQYGMRTGPRTIEV
jgi:hypothetical protein